VVKKVSRLVLRGRLTGAAIHPNFSWMAILLTSRTSLLAMTGKQVKDLLLLLSLLP